MVALNEWKKKCVGLQRTLVNKRTVLREQPNFWKIRGRSDIYIPRVHYFLIFRGNISIRTHMALQPKQVKGCFEMGSLIAQ